MKYQSINNQYYDSSNKKANFPTFHRAILPFAYPLRVLETRRQRAIASQEISLESVTKVPLYDRNAAARVLLIGSRCV